MAKRAGFLFRLMKILTIILLFLFIFISQINTIVDIDLWWNLKTGEYIVKNLLVPCTDIYSYTLGQRQWIDHEWLAQLIFFAIHSKFGWLGMNVFKALMVSMSFVLLLVLNLSRYKKIFFSAIVILLGIFAFGYRSVLRPEIFSYLFLCIYLFILEKDKGLYLLIPLQVIWTNLHGYFIVGPILLLIYLVAGLFSKDFKSAKTYGAVFAAVVLACLVNPYFYKGAIYPIGVLWDTFSRQRLFMKNVHELMMPIRFGYGKMIFFWAFAVLAGLSFLFNKGKLRLKYIFMFALGFLSAYMLLRNVPFFVFLATNCSILNLNESNFAKKVNENKTYILLIMAIILSGAIFISNGYYKFTGQYPLRETGYNFSERFVPDGACTFLKQNSIRGNIFNTIDFGPYIAYRFYPEKRIFIDTRTDLYKDEFYLLYIRALNYTKDWEMLQEKYGFEIVLLRHLYNDAGKLLRYLYKNKEWRLVYFDRISCIFLKNTEANLKIIKDFKFDPAPDLNIARFFEKLGEFNIAENIYLKLLEQNPLLLEAGNNLAGLYINSGRIEQAIVLLQDLMGRFPRATELYGNLPVAYLRKDRTEEAIKLMHKAKALNPYSSKAPYFLGMVYLEEGNLDKAARYFERYLKFEPYNAEAHGILGDIYTKKGLLKKAQAEYNEQDALTGVIASD